MTTKSIATKQQLEQYTDGLAPEKQQALADTFNPFMADVQGLVDQAKAISVESVDDRDGMAAARQTRLALRKIRCDVENTRKSLKEASLREGKAIDGMANIIKYIIVPVEEDLQAKEDYVKRIEAERIAALCAARESELHRFDVDTQHFDLGAMSGEAFEQLRASSEAGYKARIKAEQEEQARIEAEREAQRKAAAEKAESEAAERARLEAENKKLAEAARIEAEKREAIEAERRKAEAEANRLREEAERQKRESAAEAARIEAEARQAEIDRIKAEKEAELARQAAPDADKISALVAAICGLDIPSVSSDLALDAMADVRQMLNGIIKRLREAQSGLSKAQKRGGA